ncbi:MAG: AAA family ATPase, partial [Flavobacterium sp.]
MDERYLPTLISIRISNYSLYPNGLDLQYNFVQGLNLIFGGNGIGKTTFVNLIRYGLIGLYTNEFDFTRTYQGRAIEKRKALPPYYFSSRMHPEFTDNDKAEVTIIFKINQIEFEVTRSLTDDCLLKKVIVTSNGKKNELEGVQIPQPKYDRTPNSSRGIYLPFKYEEAVTKHTNLYSFDDVILFVTKILYFDEGHEAIIWDDNKKEDSIQKTLFSKYLIEKGLDAQREEASRQAKYYNS